MLSVIKTLLCLKLLFISACATSNTEQQISVKDKVDINTQNTKHIWQQVEVIYLSFEGGFYGLITENGTKLLPMNLSKQYKVAGTILKVTGHEIKDIMTTKQWGKAYKIEDIKLIKLSEKLPKDTF